MTTSSSSAAESNSKTQLFIKIFIFISLIIVLILLFMIITKENSLFIDKTNDLKGSVENGKNLFKMNCVGCHGITARGLVGPDLLSVTERLKDSQIINQVLEGRTPPMPSFEMEPQNMADLLSYLHTLN